MDEDNIKIDVAEEKDCRRIISIEIQKERYQEERKKILADFVKETALPGFRRGKVPPQMIAGRFADEIHSEVLKSIIPAAYSHAVISKELQPIGEPVFKDVVADEDRHVSFNVELEVAPEINIDNYKGIEVKNQKVKLEDGEIETVLENLRERYADYEKVERACAEGDIVVIDYTPLDKNGEEEKDKRVENYPIQLGAGTILSDFEKELIGCKPGETKEVEIDYTEKDKPKELSGRKIKYRFNIKEVKEKHLLELDDDFVSKMDPQLKTLDDLKKDIKKRLIEQKHKEIESKRQEEAIDKLIDKNPFEIPLSMIERYKESMREEAKAMGGLPEGEDAKKEQEEILDKVSRRNIKRYFLIDHIIRKEELSVEDDSVDKEIEFMTEGSSRPVEEIKTFYKKGSEQYNNLKRSLLEKQVFEIILGGNKNLKES
ncbi:trigger factor [bacterium]|nr:trigger factor [bacterium]